MLQKMIQNVLYEWSYVSIFFLVFAYFLALYFILGPLFLAICKWLHRKGWLVKIVDKKVERSQEIREIKNSLVSIFLFGFSGFPIIYWIRNGTIELLPDTVSNVLIGLLILNIWNEVHFFVVHRIMHLPFFMKRVHKVHHQSVIPTVYSVYSFHWLEAFLLSTVPITIVPFLGFAPMAIAIYPLTSILLNYSGHCNYRFGKGLGDSWLKFGTHHNEHHFKFTNNYGFVSNHLDKLFFNKSKTKK